MATPLSADASRYDDPVAPAIGVPLRNHVHDVDVAAGDHAGTVAVSVWPTRPTPFTTGLAVTNVPLATAAVAALERVVVAYPVALPVTWTVTARPRWPTAGTKVVDVAPCTASPPTNHW